jgi:CheY-like chemotaxis protein
MLEDLGHSAVAVGSGEEALTELRAAPFDLMVTDHAMPRMTGAQLIRHAAPAYPLMDIVLATGFAELPPDTADITRLRKPYSQSDLAEAIARTQQKRPVPIIGGSADSPRQLRKEFTESRSRLSP